MLDEVLTIEPDADAPGGGRWRALAVIAIAAVVVAAIVGGGAVLAQSGPAAGSPADGVAPAGTRLVGLGHAAIAVPEGWGTNKTHCGNPQEDTVVIDVGVTPACGSGWPAGVDSVEISPGTRFDYKADSTLEIDGVAAEQQATTCATYAYAKAPLCSGAVRIPSEGVTFMATSTTAAAEVDRILSWIRVLPGLVAVPGYRGGLWDEHGGQGGAYVRVLEREGLAAEIRTKKTDYSPGDVLGVAPEPGTMARPGDVVTVTVAAARDTPTVG